MLRVFGLTGGIASGKSTVARVFAARGIAVVDADLVAREIVAKGSEGLAALVAAFGDSILHPSGDLDRAKLAKIAFADPEKRRTLNAITHPRIAARTRESLAKLDEEGREIACYEAALLVENGLADAFRPLVVVSAPEDLQVERARKRDLAEEADVRARIEAQMPLAEKVAKADVVIVNDGDLATLEMRANAALDEVLRRLAVR